MKSCCNVSEEEKEKFFDTDISFIKTIQARFGRYFDEMRFVAKESIVNEILQGMLVKPELNNKIAPIFQYNHSRHVFDVKVGVRKNFEIIISQVSLRVSFCFTSQLISEPKSREDLSYFGSIFKEDESQTVQNLTAISLQTIRNVILSDCCWAFSIALVAGSNCGDSFIDVRCHMFTAKEIENVHLLAIYLTVSYAGENIANSVH